MEIIVDGKNIEYEIALFGELGGFVSKLGGKKLNELDFSEYDHFYNGNNIKNSWNTINGSGYYYPLIDYGYSSLDKLNYYYRTFRPALYVKEYMEKIISDAGYTYQSNFFNTNFFKRLIIPNNDNGFLKKDATDYVNGNNNATDTYTNSGGSDKTFTQVFQDVGSLTSFTRSGGVYTYVGTGGSVKITSLIKYDNTSFYGPMLHSLYQIIVDSKITSITSLERDFLKFDLMVAELYYTFYNKISRTGLSQWIPTHLHQCQWLIFDVIPDGSILETEYNGEVI
jgi:hypothetical protein